MGSMTHSVFSETDVAEGRLVAPAGIRPGHRYPRAMDTLVPDPAKLLAQWNEWERGEVEPGRLLANLKTGGLPDLLAALAGDEAADS